ncbi:MAG: hypothetical protein DELT_00733 [Desulfovibrio sp.]
MKYLIAEDFAGQPVAFIFPDRVTHADMREQLPYTRVLSAGYVICKNGAFACSGGDAELDVSARPEDAAIIAESFAPAEK